MINVQIKIVLVLFYCSCGTLASLSSTSFFYVSVFVVTALSGSHTFSDLFWHQRLITLMMQQMNGKSVSDGASSLRCDAKERPGCQLLRGVQVLQTGDHQEPHRAALHDRAPQGERRRLLHRGAIPVDFWGFILRVFASSRSHTRRTSIQWPLGTRRPWLQRSGWVVLIKVSMCLSKYIIKGDLPIFFKCSHDFFFFFLIVAIMLTKLALNMDLLTDWSFVFQARWWCHWSLEAK